MFTTTIKL